jgi:hypothetical protein
MLRAQPFADSHHRGLCHPEQRALASRASQRPADGLVRWWPGAAAHVHATGRLSMEKQIMDPSAYPPPVSYSLMASSQTLPFTSSGLRSTITGAVRPVTDGMRTRRRQPAGYLLAAPMRSYVPLAPVCPATQRHGRGGRRARGVRAGGAFWPGDGDRRFPPLRRTSEPLETAMNWSFAADGAPCPQHAGIQGVRYIGKDGGETGATMAAEALGQWRTRGGEGAFN